MIARGWPHCGRNKLFIVPPSALKRAITVTKNKRLIRAITIERYWYKIITGYYVYVLSVFLRP
jgi:hypothetical protein